MKDVFKSALIQLKAGKDIMLLTIIGCVGSAPRGVGARMWVSGDNGMDGTIGGGKIEYLAMQKARTLLKECRHHVEEYGLGNQEAADIGMVCGGRILLNYFYCAHEDKELIMLFERIAAQYEKREESWLTIQMNGKNNWAMNVDTDKTGKSPGPILKRFENSLIYSEQIVKNETVYIFGGGHVAQKLVPLLVTIDFECIVYDDREDFANEVLFPCANQVFCHSFEQIGKYIHISSEDYAVIMTRGHKYDTEILAWALRQKPHYIGVMGSRRKTAFVTEELISRGYKKEEIEACHMPIGTRINAQTPAEIAVSIAGELIQVRQDKQIM